MTQDKKSSEPIIQVAPSSYYAVVAGVWFTASQSAPSLDPGRLDLSISRTTRGDPATVSVTYSAPIAVPFVGWLFPPVVTLHASAAMRQEFG